MAPNLHNQCVELIQQALLDRKLAIKHPNWCKAHQWFAAGTTPATAIVVSDSEGKAGVITRVWGIAYVDIDRPVRCTDVHCSFFGTNAALQKLLRELKAFYLV